MNIKFFLGRPNDIGFFFSLQRDVYLSLTIWASFHHTSDVHTELEKTYKKNPKKLSFNNSTEIYTSLRRKKVINKKKSLDKTPF